MKNFLFVFALLFFAPVQNFVFVSFQTETNTNTVKTAQKQQKTLSNKAQILLGVALGLVIGGTLVIKTVPIFAAVCLGLGLIFCIITIVVIIKESSAK